MHHAKKFIFIIFALFMAMPGFALETVLTVSGEVAAPGEGKPRVWTFDMDDLMAMPSTEITTRTIWTQGPQIFEGVSLRTLLDHVGASGGEIEAIALASKDMA